MSLPHGHDVVSLVVLDGGMICKPRARLTLHDDESDAVDAAMTNVLERCNEEKHKKSKAMAKRAGMW